MSFSAEVFRALIEKYPEHQYASNCQYWLSECYYALGEYNNALNSFEKVFDHSNRNKDDDAQLKIAYCYEMLGQFNRAIEELEIFMAKFPTSEYYPHTKYKLNMLINK